jgi:SnoaL-like domain
MVRLRRWIAMAVLMFVVSPIERVEGKKAEQSAVERTVRDYERALEGFDFDTANSLLAPGAKWIEEDSYPAPADHIGEWWQQARAAKLRMTNRPHDFDIRILGDAAWVIVFVDTETVVDNDSARAFTLRDHPDERKWVSYAVESEVLVKAASGWKIALAHTSMLPKHEQ